jgi:acyl-CoA reductase-like NAD-dependent aldehyde dehydrogenase
MSVYAVTNPATGEQVKTFPTFTDDELDSAIALAYDTYQNWLRSSTVEERAKLVRRVGELHSERREQLARSPRVRWASRWSRRSVRSTSASTSTASTRQRAGPDEG